MRRLLIIGFGDVAQRTVQYLGGKYHVYALTRSREKFSEIRRLGATPILGDLDHPKSLSRIAGLADLILHFAPPQNSGAADKRTRNLLAALGKAEILPQRLVYISTSGVYGDCHGEWVAETRASAPQSARGIRRAYAEKLLRNWSRRTGAQVSILRVPGIYGTDRLPLERIQKGTPALHQAEDSYTNHIHKDDLARLAVIALYRGKPCRVYNASDDSMLKMGDYFDLVADSFGMPRPPRVSREEAQQCISPAMLSFMAESRRLANTRIKQELKYKLIYPDVASGVQAALAEKRNPHRK